MPAPNPLQTGPLRDVIQIQGLSAQQDGFGQPIESWNTLATVQADIDSLQEKQVFADNQFTSRVTHTVTLRWIALHIDSSMRVLCGSQVFEIQTVVNVKNRNLVLRLMCVELSPNK